ncbi:MAG: hypothetical protein LH468_10505 [Nocardioides sp.]|nr:hypothetical protein [Nocardioides sp.]
MSERQDLTAVTEAAWRGFRDRLADRMAGFEDDDYLIVEVEVGPAEDELDGAAPFLQLAGRGEGVIRAAAAGNDLLDERFHLDEHDEAVFLGVGWQRPGVDEPHFVQLSETRAADLLATRCVVVLREVYAVPHPAFLRAEGLEQDPGWVRPAPGIGAPVADELDLDEEEATLVGTHDELRVLVDAAVAQMAEVDHDSDGDIPLRAGLSVVFVRVLEDRPAVELFAEIVVDPERPERIPVELDILNRTHDFARFHGTPGAVRMSYVVVAWPFAPRQLRVVLRRMLVEVDVLAEQLALRIGGRRFLQEQEPEDPPVTQPAPTTAPGIPPGHPSHPGMSGLLELLHLGPVSSPVVGQLFEHDRRALIAHLVGVRTGVFGCAGHDEERVLTCLRRGLRYVVDREIPERRGRRLAPRTRSEQPSLISDGDLGEDTLEFGQSV